MLMQYSTKLMCVANFPFLCGLNLLYASQRHRISACVAITALETAVCCDGYPFGILDPRCSLSSALVCVCVCVQCSGISRKSDIRT